MPGPGAGIGVAEHFVGHHDQGWKENETQAGELRDGAGDGHKRQNVYKPPLAARRAFQDIIDIRQWRKRPADCDAGNVRAKFARG